MTTEFAQFFEACGDAMLVVCPSGRIRQANARAESLFGYGRGQLGGQPAGRLFPGQPLGWLPARLGPGTQAAPGAEAGQVGAGWCGELVGRRADRSQFPAEVQVIGLASGRGPAAVARIRDITEVQRARFVLELGLDVLHAEDRQREALVGHLITAREQERARIAAGIHDDTLQVLAGAGLALDKLRRDLADPAQLALLARASDRLRASMTSLRQLIFDLRPAVADNTSLAAALRAVLEQLRADTGIAYTFDDTRAAPASPHANLITHRTAREALINVGKHAHARTVRVQLLDLAHGTLARITDDGVGYRPADVENHAGHLGQTLMRERVQTSGGWCRIESAPGAGTTVEFWIPHTQPATRTQTGDGRAA